MNIFKRLLRRGAAYTTLGLLPLTAGAVEVDLLVTYDSATHGYFAGQVETAMRSWVGQVNSIYANSQVDIQLRLVGVMHRDFAGDMGTVLGQMRVDGPVLQQRDHLGADFVTHLHHNGNCGVAYIAVDRHWAFNVVGSGCGAQVMAHELGHNMGLSHSRRQGDLNGSWYGYALGYGVDNSFATTMAYPQAFNANWVPRFSNPNLSCNGLPCGSPVGAADEADAAQALNNVRGVIADFMPTKVISGGDTLNAGQSLPAGQQLVSRNGRYKLAMQTDGHLVLYSRTAALWGSGTWNTDANSLVMQTDGNLVLYGPSSARWASNTQWSQANRLILQDDGNLVLYGPHGAVWATNTVVASSGNDTLNAGQTLHEGESLVSNNGRYQLAMQTDGNLVIYGPRGPIWASGTDWTDSDKLVMQTDGNLVVYGPSSARWSSNTWWTSADRLIMQDDGNLVIYGPQGAVWASNTVGR